MKNRDTEIVNKLAAKKLTVDSDGFIYGSRGTRIGSIGKNGYIAIQYVEGNRRISVYAHRIVWIAAHGPIQSGMTINHKNGDKLDNRLENLEVLSSGDNARHAHATGLVPPPLRGCESPTAKLKPEHVQEIRGLLEEGMMQQKEIARLFGVHQSLISNIKCGKQYRDY